MSAVPAARYLTDFSEGVSRAVAPARDKSDGQATLQQQLEEAFARGAESGRVAAQAEFDAKFAGQQTLFTKRLELERQKWMAATGEKLVTGMRKGIQDLEGRISQTTARILKPFLAEGLHQQAVADLQSRLAALVATDPGISLNIKGPEDILNVLRRQLADKQPAPVFEVSEDADVKIVAGQATLETCLSDWMAKLEEAMR